MRNLLVTGGAGFIGANFVNYWVKHHPNDSVIVLDALTYAANLKNLPHIKKTSNYKFIRGNILNDELLDFIFNKHKINMVIHFAAESHVDRSIQNPHKFIETNVLGTSILLGAALKAWSKNLAENRFHHVSTDEVYGTLGPNDPPFTEQSPYTPNSPYAASKAASDHLIRAYHRTYNLPITISNCSNNYGPFQHPEKFIPTVIRSCLAWQSIPIYSDGSNIRDWLYVEDHCVAIDSILLEGQVGETYNIGGNCELNNLTLAKKICEYLDKILPRNHSYTSLITFVKDRPGHDWRYAVNSTKIQSELGFKPTVDFHQGLINTVDYYSKNLYPMEMQKKTASKLHT